MWRGRGRGRRTRPAGEDRATLGRVSGRPVRNGPCGPRAAPRRRRTLRPQVVHFPTMLNEMHHSASRSLTPGGTWRFKRMKPFSMPDSQLEALSYTPTSSPALRCSRSRVHVGSGRLALNIPDVDHSELPAWTIVVVRRHSGAWRRCECCMNAGRLAADRRAGLGTDLRRVSSLCPRNPRRRPDRRRPEPEAKAPRFFTRSRHRRGVKASWWPLPPHACQLSLRLRRSTRKGPS